jgi:hypothetical protein
MPDSLCPSCFPIITVIAYSQWKGDWGTFLFRSISNHFAPMFGNIISRVNTGGFSSPTVALPSPIIVLPIFIFYQLSLLSKFLKIERESLELFDPIERGFR